MRLGRIKEPARRESVYKEIITNAAVLSSVIRIEIVGVDGRSPEVHVSMTTDVRARARNYVKHSSETIPVFGSEAPGHQVDGFENLWADSRTELRLRVVQERYTVDEFVQRKLRAAHGKKIVVTVARARHQVIDQVICGVRQRIGKLF